MYWCILIVAGVFEAGWVIGIQKSQSFIHISYTLIAIIMMAFSLLLFSISLKAIPILHAYLVWLAVGVCTISIINHFWFNQPLTFANYVCIGFILVGIVGLKTF